MSILIQRLMRRFFTATSVLFTAVEKSETTLISWFQHEIGVFSKNAGREKLFTQAAGKQALHQHSRR